MRLGEYDTETERDCIVNEGFGEDCAPPPINVPVEDRIAHEDYDPYDTNQYHDIALLRLRRDVTYSGTKFKCKYRKNCFYSFFSF